MIMGSLRRRAIGERGIGLSDASRIMHDDQPFVVLREATGSEWLAQYTAALAPQQPDPRVVDDALRAAVAFYEVSVD